MKVIYDKTTMFYISTESLQILAVAPNQQPISLQESRIISFEGSISARLNVQANEFAAPTTILAKATASQLR